DLEKINKLSVEIGKKDIFENIGYANIGAIVNNIIREDVADEKFLLNNMIKNIKENPELIKIIMKKEIVNELKPHILQDILSNLVKIDDERALIVNVNGEFDIENYNDSRAYKVFTLLEYLFNNTDPDTSNLIGQKISFAVFMKKFKNDSVYRNFILNKLKKKNIGSKEIEAWGKWEDIEKNVPNLDKQYFLKVGQSIPELFKDYSGIILANTSGTTGKAQGFLRYIKEHELMRASWVWYSFKYLGLKDLYIKTKQDGKRIKLWQLNCFAQGTPISGSELGYSSPYAGMGIPAGDKLEDIEVKIEMILEDIKRNKLAGSPDEIAVIIAGYPPTMTKLFNKFNKKLKKMNILAVLTGGQLITGKEKNNIRRAYKKKTLPIYSLLGTTELGTGQGYQTPVCEELEEILNRKDKNDRYLFESIRKKYLGDDSRYAQIIRANDAHFTFSNTEIKRKIIVDGATKYEKLKSFFVTVADLAAAMPKPFWKTGDVGSLISQKEILSDLKKLVAHNQLDQASYLKIVKILKEIDTVQHPFLIMSGRIDGLNLYGINVYPENITNIIDHSEDLITINHQGNIMKVKLKDIFTHRSKIEVEKPESTQGGEHLIAHLELKKEFDFLKEGQEAIWQAIYQLLDTGLHLNNLYYGPTIRTNPESKMRLRIYMNQAGLFHQEFSNKDKHVIKELSVADQELKENHGRLYIDQAKEKE
ncbi:MAG: hypothetical protein KKA19_09705, partial [Candidatus Margulisbacteria bacterium]|nr:hypothetical protein [Candidatus Margulisiibacteriota bacterium]